MEQTPPTAETSAPLSKLSEVSTALQRVKDALESLSSSATSATTLSELFSIRMELKNIDARLRDDGRDAFKSIEALLDRIEDQTTLLNNRTDVAKYNLGKKFILISGAIDLKYPGRRECFEKAICDIADCHNIGTELRLRSHYFGTKDYSGFYDQREDHYYGMRPKHGHIVFSVGMTQFGRAQEVYTADELEAMLYYIKTAMERQKA
jgi:hypothetical protein